MKNKEYKEIYILWRRLWLSAAVCMCTLAGYAQQHSVTGAVSDAEGPLAGVNVSVKGTTRGVSTGGDGRYTIDVAGEDAVLVFSYIGYVRQEIRVGGRSAIDVILTEDSKTLEEVVVVGYGVQKKVSLTGSVATLHTADIRDLASSNLVNTLAGRLSGVTIKQNSGGRPGNASSIVIRARGTWNSTEPLYVIDGVARDAAAFNMLGSGEIESLSVLKDASTSAIYGSRAANGVVLVTTRKGQAGRPVIEYSGSVSAGTGFSVLPHRETAAERIAWINDYNREALVNPNSMNIPYNVASGIRYWPTIFREDGVTPINSSVFTPDEQEYYLNNPYDALNEIWSTPVTNTHTVSVSGGTERVRYFATGNYYDETGGIRTLTHNKFSVRGNVEAEIAHGLKAGLSIDLNNSNNNKPPTDDDGWRLFYFLTMASPLVPLKVDGKYTSNAMGGNFNSANPAQTNVVAVAEGAYGKQTRTRRNNNYVATLRWDVPWVKGLNLKTVFNQSRTNLFSKTWRTPYTLYELALTGRNNHIVTDTFTGASTVVGGTSSLEEQYDYSASYQWNGFVSYDNTFGGKHEMALLLGFEQYEGSGEWFNASMSNYDLQKPYFAFGPSDKNYYGIGGSGWEDARLSYLGRFNYAFDSRYLLEVSFRRDASVRFDPKYRWGFFPAASAAWRISEEAFFKDRVRFISQLKLRASYGLTGNDSVGGWQWIDGAGRSGGTYFGGTSTRGGVYIGSIANPYITWEKSRNTEAGLDVGFLDNMFTLSGGYFFRHTYDILGSQTGNLPTTFGGSLSDSNYGKVNSFGYDLELTFNRQLTRDVDVWARGNFGWADNRLVEWAETGVPPHLSRIGMNWDRSYGYVTDGIIWEMTPNGDGTYNILTSNGNRYVVNQDYKPNYEIEAQNNYAMRPGFVFINDIGSQTIDADGNTVYSSDPDGRVTPGFADKTWIQKHINPPCNYGLLLGGSWKGLSAEVFFQGTAGNTAAIQHPYASSSDWYGSSEGYWSAGHFSYENNPRAVYPLPDNFGGCYTLGENNESIYAFWLRDASFIRLKTASLSYTFDKKLLSKLGIESARIHLTGNNLALLYNPLGVYDPEVTYTTNSMSGYTGAVISTGIGVYPLIRSFALGLDISF